MSYQMINRDFYREKSQETLIDEIQRLTQVNHRLSIDLKATKRDLTHYVRFFEQYEGILRAGGLSENELLSLDIPF